MDEVSRLEDVAGWYDSREDFDYHLIKYGARTLLGHAAGPSVLEMGCSSGVMTEELVKHFADVEVVDGSATYVEAVRQLVGGQAVFHVALFEDFTPARRFHEIVLASVLEHVVDPAALARRAAGWLAPGGALHVIVPNAGALNRRLGKAMGMLARLDELHERDHRLGHRRVYGRAALEADLARAGLRVTHCEGIFLKPLSNAQMKGWSPDLLDGLYEVGKELPDYCSQIYARCVPAPG